MQGVPTRNRLLQRLPQADADRLMRRADVIRPSLRTVLCERGEPVRHALFPATGILSSTALSKDGLTAAASIGSEGMFGLGIVAGEQVNPCRVLQEVRGDVLRIPADELRAAWDASPAVREVLWRYGLALVYQGWQNTACSLHHTVNQRMCRWLLSVSDRIGGDEFDVTHEFLSEILGASRQRVTTVAGHLELEGVITCRRGKVRIVDRGALECCACDCHRLARTTYDRLMWPLAA